MTNQFPFIHVEGSAYERGFQHGQAANERIIKSIKIYKEAFYKNGMDWDEVKKLAREFQPTIKEFDSEMLEEIRGIADGANQKIEAIIALNARTELIFWKTKNKNLQMQSSDECTGAIAMPEVTANGHLIHGQNWDWIPECVDAAVIIRHVPKEGPSYIAFAEAGILARIGFNSSGIVVTGNALHSSQDSERKGIPIPLLRRKMLTSPSFPQALGAIIRAPRALSSNNMISDAAGVAINLEVAPNEVFWLYPDKGLLVHSNHFKSPIAKSKLTDTGIARAPDSLYRDYRVQSYLEPKRGHITVDDFKEAFRDHFGEPESVCRHDFPRPDGTLFGTVASIIIDSTEKKMWVAKSPICENNFIEYSLLEESKVI